MSSKPFRTRWSRSGAAGVYGNMIFDDQAPHIIHVKSASRGEAECLTRWRFQQKPRFFNR